MIPAAAVVVSPFFVSDKVKALVAREKHVGAGSGAIIRSIVNLVQKRGRDEYRGQRERTLARVRRVITNLDESEFNVFLSD
jgi:hypothetical protein